MSSLELNTAVLMVGSHDAALSKIVKELNAKHLIVGPGQTGNLLLEIETALYAMLASVGAGIAQADQDRCAAEDAEWPATRAKLLASGWIKPPPRLTLVSDRGAR